MMSSKDRNENHIVTFTGVRRIIADTLQYPDELLHVAVYEWMMAKEMDGELIKSPQPSLEKYLVKASQQSQDNLAALNLLWKYYENNKDHAAAAKVLDGLASKTGNVLTLKDRLSYLIKATMCMRSASMGYGPHLGVFLKDLEDKLDLAKVQEQVLDAIMNLRGIRPNTEEAIAALNSGLYDLTQLYEQFADPFNLWECKLAIVNCAGYPEVPLIESIWEKIIDEEFKKSSGTADNRLTQVLMKVTSLIHIYKFSSPSTIALDFIVKQLSIISMKLKANPTIVPNVLMSDVSLEDLICVYNSIICCTTLTRLWSLENCEFHLSEAFAELANNFLSNESKFDHKTKTKIKALFEDMIAKLLSILYSKPNANRLIEVLKNIQSRLAEL